MKRTDCIFYNETKRREYCGALKELYCSNEDCKFYKTEQDYNPNGAKKGGSNEISAGS